jgi:hypothetical protein
MAESEPSSPVDKAEDWLDEKTQPPGDRPKGLEDAHDTPTVSELRREQRREISHAMFGTEGQTHGAVFGGLAGAAVGAVLGVVVGLLVFDSGSPARIVVPAVVAVFASLVGFVYWGGRTPELENETMSTAGVPESGTTPRDPGTDDRGR